MRRAEAHVDTAGAAMPRDATAAGCSAVLVMLMLMLMPMIMMMTRAERAAHTHTPTKWLRRGEARRARAPRAPLHENDESGHCGSESRTSPLSAPPRVLMMRLRMQ